MPYSSISSATIVMSTELNSLASGARSLSANPISANTATSASWQLAVTFATAPTAGGLINLFIIPSIDGGTTYADGSATIDPEQTRLLASFPVRSVTTAQVLIYTGTIVPPGNFKLLIRNDTNQSFAATGNTLSYATFNPN